MTASLPFLAALATSLALTWGAIHIFPRLGLLDNPQKYGLKRAPIPYFGGLTIFATFALLTAVFLPFTRPILALLAGATLLTLVSFVDDRQGVRPLIRLGVQVIAAGLLVLGGVGIASVTNPFGGVIDFAAWDLPILAFGGEYHFWLIADLFTIAWVVLLVNAINWFDGVAGLASSISGIAALAIFFLAARAGYHYFDQSAVIALAAILAGSALGFAVWNISPPKILLGDTGSMLLGYVLAALAIYAGSKIATAALVLGLPILDALFVSAYRLAHGRAPWRGGEWDRDRTPVHLHHRLIAAGFTERQILLIILGVSALFGTAALLIDTTAGKVIAAGVLVGLMLVGYVWLERRRTAQ